MEIASLNVHQELGYLRTIDIVILATLIALEGVMVHWNRTALLPGVIVLAILALVQVLQSVLHVLEIIS